jgi:transcription termination factor NusA
MQVKITKSTAGIGYAYTPGESPDLPVSLANELVELGYAVILHHLPTVLPAAIPGRKILVDAGFETVEELKKLSVKELIDIKGIGNKLAEAIFQYINA